jgi:hypothetical protein
MCITYSKLLLFKFAPLNVLLWGECRTCSTLVTTLIGFHLWQRSHEYCNSINAFLAWLSAEFSYEFQNPYYFPAGAMSVPASVCFM